MRYRPQDTNVRKRWLCLVRRCDGAGWSRRTSLPSNSRRDRRSGRGGTRGSPPSAPSTSNSTASERAHIRAATAAPCRAPLRAATPPARPALRTRHSLHATSRLRKRSHARSDPSQGRDSCAAHTSAARPARASLRILIMPPAAPVLPTSLNIYFSQSYKPVTMGETNNLRMLPLIIRFINVIHHGLCYLPY